MKDQPSALKTWLEKNREQIARRWRAEIRSREDRRAEDGDGFLGRFLDSLTAFLPPCLGNGREHGEEIWHQATHLYGVLALRRGLASGEVVEELLLLRQVVLRLLLDAPPSTWDDRGFQLDFLALNQLLDGGVVRASVAYVDDLFFSHLQGSGVPEGVGSEVEAEMERQLETFRRDLPS